MKAGEASSKIGVMTVQSVTVHCESEPSAPESVWQIPYNAILAVREAIFVVKGDAIDK
jgi:hypothetical protein